MSVDHGTHGRGVHDEGGGVVEHPLPLEDRDETVRQAQAPSDGRRRHGIRSSDDRSEHPGRPPAETRRVGDDGDEAGARDGEAHGEQEDRAGLPPELPERGPLRRGEEQRRQDDGQDEVGVELDPRHPRDERDDQAEQRQEDRQRDAQAIRERREDDDPDEERGEQQGGGHQRRVCRTAPPVGTSATRPVPRATNPAEADTSRRFRDARCAPT